METENFKAQGGCRCDDNPVRYEYTKTPAEMHYCLCSDCTDICGGALAILAVIERAAFKFTQGEDKVKTYDSKETVHRQFCKDCGCHLLLLVDGSPDYLLLHVPTLDHGVDPGAKPDRWVFVDSKNPLLTLPEDGLPRFPKWGDPVAT